jgi:3-hydroxyacyl-[acyl-carrier-protein] dehydratase
MLLNNFFYIKLIEEVEGKYLVRIELNEKHSIYQGHFPGMPVTPGVCLVQMVKESAGVIMKKKLMMSKADHIKFIAIVNPLENKVLFLDLNIKETGYNQWMCECITYFEKTIFFKLKAHFSAIGEQVGTNG